MSKFIKITDINSKMNEYVNTDYIVSMHSYMENSSIIFVRSCSNSGPSIIRQEVLESVDVLLERIEN